jgi:uroporphyrinogen decarboxylase
MNKREFLKTSLVATSGLGLLSGGINFVSSAENQEIKQQEHLPAGSIKINKREKLLSVLDQSKPNQYVPAAFFMHFPEKFGEPAAKRHIDYFKATNMDVMKVQYELFLPRLEIQKPEDWAKVPVYGADFFEPVLALIEYVAKELKSEALILPTVYGTFSLASQTSGRQLLEHAQENPDAVAKGIKNLTESLFNYTSEAIKRGADGFYYSTQGGDSKHFAESELFDTLIGQSDIAVLRGVNDKTLLNILHICDFTGPYNEISKFHSYPASIINTPFALKDGNQIHVKDVQKAFHRPVMGGLNRNGVISGGTFEQIVPEIDSLLKEASPNFILGADCTIRAEWNTLRKLIDYTHTWREKN